MLKKIAAAAALAGALAFSAAAPAVLSAGSHGDPSGTTSARVGNWPDPMSTTTKGNSAEVERGKSAEQISYITYVGNWPDPM
ncbi:hypothetical protein ACIQC0_12910 [Pseudarthrobacter sp. NPDC092419]|uniref:hypothetical protein n=1 Tax=Pseudarthrobacter sp. NPDC092419 TaxID=3364414 RepID=UPI00380DD9FD